MPKFDNITYPTPDEDLLKYKPLGDMYRAFLKKRYATENWMFLDQTAKKIDPKKQYPIYFDDDGKYSVNVASKIKNQAKELARAENWKSGEWRTIYAASRKEVNDHLVQNFGADFYNSPEFKAHHAVNLRKVIRIPKGLKQQLAVEDDNVLADTVVLFMTDKKAGAKAAKSLAASYKCPLSPDQIGKAIAKFFKLR